MVDSGKYTISLTPPGRQTAISYQGCTLLSTARDRYLEFLTNEGLRVIFTGQYIAAEEEPNERS